MAKTVDASNDAYYVNEVIVLRADTYAGDSKQAVDPDTVTLSSFTLDGQTVGLATHEFTRIDEGIWEIDLTTNHLDAGIYEYQVLVRGELGQTIIQDRLVIKEAQPAVEVWPPDQQEN